MKLKIRSHLEKDIPYRVKWLNDDIISKYIWTVSNEKTVLKKQEEWFRNYRKDKNKRFFTICDNEEPIWFMWLSNISKINKNAELFIMIWEISYHWKWVWRLALNALIKIAFDKYNLHKLNLWVYEENLPAVWLYKSLWFKIEWRFIEEAFFDWKFHNTLSMAIFQKDWLKHKL